MSVQAEIMSVPQIGPVQNVRDHLNMGLAFIRSGFESLKDSLDGRVQQVAAVALVASVSMTACGGGSEKATIDNLGAQPVGAVSADLLKVLNPQNVETHCATLADKFKLDTFDRGDGTRGVSPRLEYQAPVGDGKEYRKYSDALGTPFSNTDPKLVDREKAAVMCADPVQGVGMLNFLAELKVDGQKVADLNPRLKPFEGSADKIDDIAAGYMPLLGETRNGADIPAGEIENAVAMHNKYQGLIDMASQIMAGFKPAGTERTSATNSLRWANKGMQTGAKGLPVSEYADEKDGMFARYDLVGKGEECPTVSIGFNIGVKGKVDGGDKRPAMLPNQCEAPATTATQGTTPEGTTPQRTVVSVGATTTSLRLPDGTTTTIQHGTTTTTRRDGTTTTTRQDGTTTTTAGGNTTTTVGEEGKNHNLSGVGGNRNDPDQRDRPNVPDEPVRAVPPVPDEVIPNRGDSGTGSVNTVPTPVDEVPANNTTPTNAPVNQPRPDGQPTPAR